MLRLDRSTLKNRHPTRQNPQCEGVFRDRWLFNGNVSDKRTTSGFYKIRKAEGDAYVIDAGEAAGITVGAEFKVYQNSGDFLGTVRVAASELSAFFTTLCAKKYGIALEQDGVALKSRAGTEEGVRICVADERLKDILKRIDPNQIQLVEQDRAEFGMHSRTKKLYSTTMTPRHEAWINPHAP